MCASSQYQSACIYGGGIYTSVLPILFNSNIDVIGSVTALLYDATSDYRIKDNIKNLDDDELYIVDYLKPIQYDNKLTGSRDIGFIADEVQQIYPFLVNGQKNDLENQSLNYLGLLGILVKETKDLKKRINKLEEN